MVCGNFILPEPASYVFFYAIFNLRKLFYLIAQCDSQRNADALNRGNAQLTPDEKDAISHRGNALAELEKQLPSFLGE